MDKHLFISLARMVRLATAETTPPAVKRWARRQGAAYLMELATMERVA